MQSMHTALHGKALPVHTKGKRTRTHRACTLRTAAQAAATANGTSNGAAATNGAAINNGLEYQIQDTFPPGQVAPVSPEVQALLDDQGLDFETSGLAYLTNEARVSLFLAK